jgi:hypothetical protein
MLWPGPEPAESVEDDAKAAAEPSAARRVMDDELMEASSAL